jgi:hypothetical protein
VSGRGPRAKTRAGASSAGGRAAPTPTATLNSPPDRAAATWTRPGAADETTHSSPVGHTPRSADPAHMSSTSVRPHNRTPRHKHRRHAQTPHTPGRRSPHARDRRPRTTSTPAASALGGGSWHRRQQLGGPPPMPPPQRPPRSGRRLAEPFSDGRVPSGGVAMVAGTVTSTRRWCSTLASVCAASTTA